MEKKQIKTNSIIPMWFKTDSIQMNKICGERNVFSWTSLKWNLANKHSLLIARTSWKTFLPILVWLSYKCDDWPSADLDWMIDTRQLHTPPSSYLDILVFTGRRQLYAIMQVWVLYGKTDTNCSLHFKCFSSEDLQTIHND